MVQVQHTTLTADSIAGMAVHQKLWYAVVQNTHDVAVYIHLFCKPKPAPVDCLPEYVDLSSKPTYAATSGQVPSFCVDLPVFGRG